jgi:hypothetical protein
MSHQDAKLEAQRVIKELLAKHPPGMVVMILRELKTLLRATKDLTIFKVLAFFAIAGTASGQIVTENGHNYFVQPVPGGNTMVSSDRGCTYIQQTPIGPNIISSQTRVDQRALVASQFVPAPAPVLAQTAGVPVQVAPVMVPLIPADCVAPDPTPVKMEHYSPEFVEWIHQGLGKRVDTKMVSIEQMNHFWHLWQNAHPRSN